MTVEEYIEASRNGIELWKDIPGWANKYQASTLGKIKRLEHQVNVAPSWNRPDGCIRTYPEMVMKQNYVPKTGYYTVTIGGRLRFTSVWVAMAFLGHISNGYKIVVDHKNNDKSDNRLCNLDIITARKNLSKDRVGGTSQYIGVSWNKRGGIWVAYIKINGKSKYLGRFNLEEDAAIAYQNALKGLQE